MPLQLQDSKTNGVPDLLLGACHKGHVQDLRSIADLNEYVYV